MTADLRQGDVLECLRGLPDESVHVCITSPPYYSLRDYSCPGQIGLEATVEEHLEKMVEVFAEVKRVLRADGCLFLNYGDAYCTGPLGSRCAYIVGDEGDGAFKRRHGRMIGDGPDPGVRRKQMEGYKPKDLMGLPWRVAFALQADGWWLRSAMPWVKRSAMPESCTDRPSTALEYVFLLAKSSTYFWDADSVRRPHNDRNHPVIDGRFVNPKAAGGVNREGWEPPKKDGLAKEGWVQKNREYNPNGRNLRNADFYWDSLDLAIEQARAELAHLEHIRERGGLLLDAEGEPLALDVNTEAQREQHFACFPRKLVEPLIKAGTSERGVCAGCGSPWRRVTEKQDSGRRQKMADSWDTGEGGHGTIHRNGREKGAPGVPVLESVTLGWKPSCKCNGDATVPATVLDPFAGSGTTLSVALSLGRRAIGIELSEAYVKIAQRRLKRTQLPLELEMV